MSSAKSEKSEMIELEEAGFDRLNVYRCAITLLKWGVPIVVVGCLVWELVTGNDRMYEPGPVSTAHAIIANKCSKCHTQHNQSGNWLDTFDDKVFAVPNSACIDCHQGPIHHQHQSPAHSTIACAQCHREHQTDDALARVADRHCVECHGDLKEHSSKPPLVFGGRIEEFSKDQHPDFALQRLLEDAADIHADHGVRSVLAYFERTGEKVARWQDRANIRFNHAKHLVKGKSENGKLMSGLAAGRDEHGEVHYVDLSDDCQRCHQPDAARRYMQPINYEKHCAECHPLLFDNEQAFRGKTVPHGRADVVRGFLTELYTLNVVKNPNAEIKPAKIHRGLFPGRRPLAAEQAKSLESKIAAAEGRVFRHTHTLFGYEAQGGCRYCHQVNEPAEGQGRHIEPPGIPDRWMKHSKFRHDSHRMLACTQCHPGVHQSQSTGDVLMPPMSVCLHCHNAARTDDEISRRPLSSARADCVQCHNYHKRENENFNGLLDVDLKPIQPKAGRIGSGDGST